MIMIKRGHHKLCWCKSFFHDIKSYPYSLSWQN